MTVVYSPDAVKQIEKLDKPIQKRIIEYMDGIETLSDPRSKGKKLVGNLAEYWRYRVGDYRILCKIEDAQLVVSVVQVAHRKKVYK